MRRLMAVAFLAFLLVEWGSHNLAFAHSSTDDGRVASSHESTHEDLCKTLIRCSDGTRQEQRAPNFGHELLRYGSFLDNLQTLQRSPAPQKDPRLRRPSIRGLSRPEDPPFHPPKLS